MYVVFTKPMNDLLGATPSAVSGAGHEPQREWLLMGDSRGLDRIDAKLLPEQARRHNRSLILQTLYTGGTLSRADLARITGLTKVSVSHVVEDLLAEHMLREVGVVELAGRGKPPMMLEFNNEAFQIIGIDLSHSTLFRGAVMDPQGNVLHRADFAIENRQGRDALELVEELVGELQRMLTGPLLGIGIGSPGVVSSSGVVLRAQSLGWEHLDLRSTLSARFNCHVSVANDANLAAEAERSYAAGNADMVLVRIGHEVGAGLLLSGARVVGSRFAAGEIGHVYAASTSALECACGKHGCLETLLASARLDAAVKSCTNEGERREVLAEAGTALGAVLAPLIAALDLAEIVLSGPRLVLEGPLSDAVRVTVRERATALGDPEVPVRITELGDDIVLRGATARVMREQLGIS